MHCRYHRYPLTLTSNTRQYIRIRLKTRNVIRRSRTNRITQLKRHVHTRSNRLRTKRR
ncbi:MAG: hypothetical protein NZ576_12720 [Bacteroidia bacterium]|nr:hypothetical protein [Bacteroidia bacterium]